MRQLKDEVTKVVIISKERFWSFKAGSGYRNQYGRSLQLK